MENASIKGFILPELTSEEDGAQKIKRKKPAVSYGIEANSGIDLVIKKKTARTETYMVLILSQGQFYIKSGAEIVKLTADSYVKFWSAYDGESFETDNEVFNHLEKGTKFAEAFCKMLEHEQFAKLCKAGLCDVKLWCANYGDKYSKCKILDYVDNSYYAVKVYSWASLFLENAKFVRYIIQKEAEHEGVTEREARNQILAGAYGKGRSQDSYMLTSSGLLMFIAIRNIYGLDIARDAYELWASNDFVRRSTMSYTKLAEILMPGKNESAYREISGNMMKGIKPDIIFDGHRFIEYLFVGANEAGYSDRLNEWMTTWRDTLRMQRQIYGKVVDKYPDKLVSEHDRLAFMTRVRNIRIDAEQWAYAAEQAANLEAHAEVNGVEWIFVAPKTTADIADEATQQSNCVASYIRRMTDGDCVIMFLRLAKEPLKSVCTVEVRDKEIVQFKAARNQTPTAEQYEAMIRLAKKSGLTMRV